MNNLLTDNPIALKALLSEEIYLFGEENKESTVAEPNHTEVVTPSLSQTQNFATTSDTFIYQGSKEKGVLFILRYPDYPYFSPEAENAFNKMMDAVQLGKENVAVVNLANAHNPNDFKQIMQYFTPTKIILLGVEPSSLKLPLIAHNSYMKGKIATVFNTFSFEDMFADQQKKKAFWQEFKEFIHS